MLASRRPDGVTSGGTLARYGGEESVLAGGKRRVPKGPKHKAPKPMHWRRTAAAAVVTGLVIAGGSEAPVGKHPSATADDRPPISDDLGISGGGPVDVGEPPVLPSGPTPGPTPLPGSGAPGAFGIPATVLDAYQQAAQELARSDTSCHLTWQMLAGIGKVESDHAWGGRVDAQGTTLEPILGPRLDGHPGVAALQDTDDGRWDGDPVWERAVGPMQFIPSAWRMFGQDGNQDGRRDPNNVYDAALAAARYLCSGDRDLSDQHDLEQAIFGYNHSDEYVEVVMKWIRVYSLGEVTPIPDHTGSRSAPQPPYVPPRSNTGTGSRQTTPPGSSPPKSTQPAQPAKPTAQPPSEPPVPTWRPTTLPPWPTPTPTPPPSGSPSPSPTCPTPVPTNTASPTPTPTPTSTPTGPTPAPTCPSPSPTSPSPAPTGPSPTPTPPHG